MTRNERRRRSTIYDIATAAEASISTVSLVLNGNWSRYRIKEDTAQRVLTIAKQLGYNVNLKARGLRLSRSGLAGMILPHYRNRFFADIAETFEARARKLDLCPVVVSTQRQFDIESRVAKTLLDQQVEFLFIVGVPRAGELNRLCETAGVPCVKVPVLSNTMVSTSAKRSMCRPLLMMMPLRAALVMNDRTAVGAATRMPVP